MTNDGDQIDFKPFLDMAIGVLFVLLILIASQMFFQRAATEEDTPQQTHRLAWEKESAFLMQRMTSRLETGGFAARSDLRARTVSLPLETVVGIEAGRPRANPQAVSILAEVLDDELACLVSATARSVCPAYQFLRLGLFKLTYTLTRYPVGTATLPAEAYGRLVSSIVSAAIAEQRPTLLALPGSAARPALEREVAQIQIADSPTGVLPLEGFLTISFTFDGALMAAP
jgi:hypothetical protein